MLKVYSSNRLESLFDDLSDILAVPLADPLMAEIILVQSQGMARWLSLKTASYEGIAANLDCSFPATFIWRLLRQHGSLYQNDPYERDSLRWAIYILLGELQDHKEFGPVRKYLSGSQHSLKLYQLSNKIAALFDQYMIFRPDWIGAWSAGAGEGWQPLLWRAVEEKYGANNRAFLLQEFLANENSSLLQEVKLPERLCLFGIPALPPSMLALFAKIAQQLDIHLFLLQPCMEYWADLLSIDELSRVDLRKNGTLETKDELHFEQGNQLLMNMGKMGRDFQQVLHSFEFEEFNSFSEPSSTNLLSAMQANILRGVDGMNDDFVAPQNDRSIQVHRVHSPMREVEVLFQNLLGLFQEDVQLGPADVLVMVPNIDLYAPFIEAVFSTPESASQALPFTIADTGSVGLESVKIYLQLLSLLESRMTSAQVFDFLSQEKVRSSFGMNEGEMETVRNWIEKSAIFWGTDGQHCTDLGVADDHKGTWQAGLDRLLLGLALPTQEELFYDILPCDLVEGAGAQLLAKFIHFIDTLRDATRNIAIPKKPREWGDVFRQLLHDFITPSSALGKDQREQRTILNAIDAFVRQTDTAQFDQSISYDIVQAVLLKEFEASSGHSDFLSGSITFCQMVPMRSIPFEVICLLGMNDSDFPRQDRPLGFDLMRDHFRPGDRSRRDDDRYLFLETILSARKLLYISYVGIGVHSSEIFPPSVVVSELLEALCSLYPQNKEDDGGRQFITTHPLQPFSSRYFLGESALKNFSELSHGVAENLNSSRQYGGLFQQTDIHPEKVNTSSEKLQLSLSEFIGFFEHPVRFLLRSRLGLNLSDRHYELEERERLTLNNFERYQLLNAILDLQLNSGRDRQDNLLVAKRFQEKGLLPFGRMGHYEMQQLTEEADGMLGKFSSQLTEVEPRSQLICFDSDRLRITGKLNNIWSAGQFLIRPTSIKNMSCRDLVHFWLSHLLLCADEDSPEMTTHFICKDGHLSFPIIENAAQELAGLADLLLAGMTKPLPFFPRATTIFAKQMWQVSDSLDLSQRFDRAVWDAQTAWFDGSMFATPERQDPYIWTAFGEKIPFEWGGAEPLGFENCAEIVFRRLFEVMVKGEG